MIYESEPHEKALVIDVAATISSLLYERRMLQQDLAREMGVSPAAISKLVADENNLTLKTLARIGFFLGVKFAIVPIGLPGHRTPEFSRDMVLEIVDPR